jgi:hypothetical protein
MKLVAWMILLSGVVLFILATVRPGKNPGTRGPENARNSSVVSDPPALAADEAALQQIKREHATGRFPFLVSSLCRDFLERYPASPHRVEVENILERSQEHISESERQSR